MSLRVVSWETSKSRARQRRYEELRAEGVTDLRPPGPPKFSRLHLARNVDHHMLCGLRCPEGRKHLVIDATGPELERMGGSPEVRAVFQAAHAGPCVYCATSAAMEVDHVLIAGHGGGTPAAEARCGCGWRAHGMDDPLEAWRAHVERVVRNALLDDAMTPGERRLFRALEAA